LYKRILKPLLFLFDAESVHNFVFIFLKFIFKIPLIGWSTRLFFNYSNPKLEKELLGLKFKNPVGLAAGFDKDAKLIDELSNFGFGFIEIGTLTPNHQTGNPKPRLFRLEDDQALINRMGFNNQGVLDAVERLRRRSSDIIVGGNIGKDKETSIEKAIEDFEYCFEALFDLVDYFVVNVSSPNTPHLRDLQNKEPLQKLLLRMKDRSNTKKQVKPILLKIAPDLENSELDDIVDIVKEINVDGIIATNTTTERLQLTTNKDLVKKFGEGGLSGKPLNKKANKVIRYLSEKLDGKVPIIGVGGIQTVKDAIEMLEAGADLIQIYTGFIFEGPSVVKKINKGIARYLAQSQGK